MQKVFRERSDFLWYVSLCFSMKTHTAQCTCMCRGFHWHWTVGRPNTSYMKLQDATCSVSPSEVWAMYNSNDKLESHRLYHAYKSTDTVQTIVNTFSFNLCEHILKTTWNGQCTYPNHNVNFFRIFRKKWAKIYPVIKSKNLPRKSWSTHHSKCQTKPIF